MALALREPAVTEPQSNRLTNLRASVIIRVNRRATLLEALASLENAWRPLG